MGVSLRTTKLKGGRRSLYVEVYKDEMNSYRQTLGLYLEPGTNQDIIEKNKLTKRIAEKIKVKLETDLLNDKFGEKDPREEFSHNFVKYFDSLVDERYETGIHYHTYYSVQQHLHRFSKGTIRFVDLDESTLERFKSYILSVVSQNSANAYFNLFKKAVHVAHRRKLIDTDPAFNIKSPRYINPKREFLTEDEIKLIIPTKCKFPILKQAFLFSCMTGLRWSDVQNLKWSNVIEEDGVTYLDYTQRKTKDAERLPITKEARTYIGEKREPDERVFKGLRYSAHMNDALRFWMLESGIKKRISFHCSRHTHACLLLNKGVELYTVSKLLGHKDIKTTQIYAKLVNKSKVDAIEKLPSIFGG